VRTAAALAAAALLTIALCFRITGQAENITSPIWNRISRGGLLHSTLRSQRQLESVDYWEGQIQSSGCARPGTPRRSKITSGMPSPLMTLRYLSTLQQEDSLRIQQDVEFD